MSEDPDGKPSIVINVVLLVGLIVQLALLAGGVRLVYEMLTFKPRVLTEAKCAEGEKAQERAIPYVIGGRPLSWGRRWSVSALPRSTTNNRGSHDYRHRGAAAAAAPSN